MFAVEYRFSLPRFVATHLAGKGRAGRSLALSAAVGTERPEPRLPGDRWLRVRPVYSGICGSDLALLTASGSPSLSPFLSFPCVLGHEVVGRVEAVGEAVPDLHPGELVAVDPFISCFVRGLEPCPSCRAGATSVCWRTAEGPLAPGMLLGFCRDLPGSWSEAMLAHRSQVHRIPNAVAPEAAALVEPLAVGLHAVLRTPPPPGSRILVLGGGTVGLCLLAAIRLLGLDAHVTVAARHPGQVDLARRLGADHIVSGQPEAVGRAAAEMTGARELRPLRGLPVYSGGFTRVYDAVGSQESLRDALRVAAPRGEVVLVGCAAEIPRTDWSFVWSKELGIRGSYGYGIETWGGERAHTFDLAATLLAARPQYPVADLVTHRYPLRAYREALAAAVDRRGRGSVKTLLACSPAER